ncbi:MAG: ABC transporter permease [Acidobacteriota bacterium]
MQIELTRGVGGGPEAIRIRFGQTDTASRTPGLLVRGWRRAGHVPLIRMAGRIASWPVRVVALAIPSIAIDREHGRASRIRIRLGAHAGPGLGLRVLQARSRLAAAPAALGALLGRVREHLPSVVFRRDEAGRLAAIAIQLGRDGAAVEGAAIVQKDQRWVIEPAQTGLIPRMQEFWRYRQMLWFMASKGVTRMYQGMNLGVFWLFVRPLLPIVISTLIFGRLLNVPSEGVPYFLFFLAGSTAWMLFERSLLWATRSLDMHKGLVKKVYFPRLIVPIASVAPAVVDAFVYAGLLVVACVYFWIQSGRWYLRIGPGLGLALIASLLSVVLAIAVGLWTSVIQVKAKETRFTLRYVTRFWNYLTPVLYPVSQVPEKYHWIVFLNPMAPLVEMFKAGTIGVGQLNWASFGSALAVIGIVFASGVWFFMRSEAAAVDRL